MNAFVGSSKSSQRIRSEVKKISKSRGSVLIVGEEGVGKKLVAESLHAQSNDAKKPIVRLNLSAIDGTKMQALGKSIVDQRLFRNPSVSSHGDFRLPKGSTIVFENVEESSLAVQRIVCELLDASKTESLGYRYIFLLKKELKEQRAFDDSLYAQVKSFKKIQIPPLRERPQDIIDLVEVFLTDAAQALGIEGMAIDPNTLDILVRHEWKANVRELKECIAQSIVMSGNTSEFRLPEKFISEQTELQRVLDKIEEGVEFAIDNSMSIIQKRLLERVLEKFNNNQSRAARFLRITEDTLRYRMKKLGIRNVQKQ